MTRAPTDGVGIVARAAPLPPRVLVDPLAPRLRSIAADAEVECQSPFSMARAPTDGVGVAVWQPLRPPARLSLPWRRYRV